MRPDGENTIETELKIDPGKWEKSTRRDGTENNWDQKT